MFFFLFYDLLSKALLPIIFGLLLYIKGSYRNKTVIKWGRDNSVSANSRNPGNKIMILYAFIHLIVQRVFVTDTVVNGDDIAKPKTKTSPT